MVVMILAVGAPARSDVRAIDSGIEDRQRTLAERGLAPLDGCRVEMLDQDAREPAHALHQLDGCRPGAPPRARSTASSCARARAAWGGPRPGPLDPLPERLDGQRRARSGETATTDDQQGNVGPPHRELQPKRHGRRQAWHPLAQIQRDQRESRTANEHVGGAKRHLTIASATNPQETAEIDSGLTRPIPGRRSPRCRRAPRSRLGPRPRPRHASRWLRATGREPADDLGDLASNRRQAVAHAEMLIT